MAQHRTRQFRSRSGPNRTWAGFHTAANVAVAANTKVLLGTFSQGVAGIDETILRTVGILQVVTDQVAANENQVGALGMIVVNDLAVAAGAASIPGPITDIADDGWFLYVPFAQLFKFSTAVHWETNAGGQYQFDSKAKRKIQRGFQVAVMVENGSATDGLFVTAVVRQLAMITGT